jgi:predicted transcriptional regulator
MAAAMTEVTFTFRVSDELKSAFAEAARLQDRTAAQLLRDFMRDLVQRQRQESDYEAWLTGKVQASRRSAQAGRLIPASEVEAEFAVRRMRGASADDSAA